MTTARQEELPAARVGPVSVIIPAYRAPLLGEVLDALHSQRDAGLIGEVIVVGQACEGQSAPGEPVRWIETARRIPAGAARNQGAAVARGTYLLFLDADCLLEPDSVARLVAAVDGGFDAATGGVRPEPGSYWRLCHNLMAFPEFTTLDQLGERPSLPSLCLIVRRDAWLRVGPFDEQLPSETGEDLDWSYRARQAGCRLGCAPDAALRHRPERTSIAEVWLRHMRYGESWRTLHQRHRALLPPSQAVWLAERLGDIGPAAFVMLAALYVLRLVARRPHLLRLWPAVPGMIWAQLAWYYGIKHSYDAERASGTPRESVEEQ
ncbi:MAG TPA: glycosyltransferase [Roseiflexaceae bacterium]|nr:glycosyltransferase [Roseiflexaceae bacterium]